LEEKSGKIEIINSADLVPLKVGTNIWVTVISIFFHSADEKFVEKLSVLKN